MKKSSHFLRSVLSFSDLRINFADNLPDVVRPLIVLVRFITFPVFCLRTPVYLFYLFFLNILYPYYTYVFCLCFDIFRYFMSASNLFFFLLC